MRDNKQYNKFMKKQDYSPESILDFECSYSMTHKQLIRKTFKQLNSTIGKIENTQYCVNLIFNYVDLICSLCDMEEFDEEEVLVNRKRVKKTREAILAYANKFKNQSLLDAANKLDQLALDKNIDVEDLIKLIKELINKREDINIIKKLLNTNKGAIVLNQNELFDYAFHLAIDSLVNNTAEIYYYIALLKIFYSTTIDNTKYVKLLYSITSHNIYTNEIYMIIYGNKRSLKKEDIFNKYGIITDLQSQGIILPNKSNNDDLVLTIDDINTRIKDDGLSIKKDGNKYIVGIHIADVGSFILQNTMIDKQAINNYKCIYLLNGSIRLFSNKTEDGLSLNKNTDRRAITLYVVFDDNLNIIDYYLKENIIRVSESLSYEQTDKILDNRYKTDITSELNDLYMIAEALEIKNKKKKEYWDKKNKQTHQDVYVYHKSNKIVSEFMILYNRILAEIMCNNSFPYVYRTQDNSYLESLANKLNIQLDESTKKIMRDIYLPSKYSHVPLYHNGLNLQKYSHSTNCIRRYSDLYNQYLLHNFYFCDKQFDFDYDEHLYYIQYFNQRNVELSLMRSEYSRALKLEKKS